jgi:cephalosporin hydroxylase
MTLREWVDGEHRNGTFALPGVLAWKNVFDLSVIQEIIHETQH